MKYLRSYLYTLSINQSCHRQNLLFQRVLVFSQNAFFFISLSYFMVFQFRSSIIDTRYFVSLYFSLQRVREEYCICIYIYIRFTKRKVNKKKKKKKTRDKLYRYAINFSKYNGEEDWRVTRNTSNNAENGLVV